MTHLDKSQNGNILFILLVALALFAGLTLVMSDAGQNLGNGKSEKADIIASEIIDYANSVKIAVQKAILNGCADADISFENEVVTGYEHGGAGAPDKCKIFKSTGGKVRWKTPDKNWLIASASTNTFYFPNELCILNAGLNGPDASGPTVFCDNAPEAIDLMIFLPGLKKDICEEINKNIANSKDIPRDLSEAIRLGRQFTGSFQGGSVPEIADNNGTLTGKLSYCYQTSSGASNFANQYSFYMVLLAR
jgi:hypothetical protein